MNRASIEMTFFIITPPELVELAMAELKQKKQALGLSNEKMTPLEGGIEITCSWEKGRGLCHVLKIPTRILVRLHIFKARDLPKFYQKLIKIAWSQILSHPTPQIKISAKECRLMHTTKLTQCVQEALTFSQKGSPLSLRYQKEEIPPETLYLRGEKDEWTLSLDLCGDPLYKRGLSIIKDEAPLRETIASCGLWLLSQQLSTPHFLWDPMCGSGTFITEAQHFHRPLVREFSYQKSVMNLGVAPWKLSSDMKPLKFSEVCGSDKNENLIKKVSGPFFTQDFFDNPTAPQRAERVPLALIINPPYGERLKLPGGIKKFQLQLLDSMEKSEAQHALILHPTHWKWPSLKYPSKTLLNFKNGGIPVSFSYFKRA
jgi:putative N6-adenine-specific DNA methylase